MRKVLSVLFKIPGWMITVLGIIIVLPGWSDNYLKQLFTGLIWVVVGVLLIVIGKRIFKRNDDTQIQDKYTERTNDAKDVIVYKDELKL